MSFDKKTYAVEKILLGICRSVKASASDILRRIGTKADIVDVLLKPLMVTSTHQSLF